MTSPFTLSIETSSGTFQYPFHLGTIEKLAREMAQESFLNPPRHKMKPKAYVVTVALMRDGHIFDVWDGSHWSSELAEDLFATEYEERGGE